MNKFTFADQVEYARLALCLLEFGRENSGSLDDLETVLEFGELIKKHADYGNNATIFDATEYIYEQLRLLRGEEGAYDDIEMRKSLEESIAFASSKSDKFAS